MRYDTRDKFQRSCLFINSDSRFIVKVNLRRSNEITFLVTVRSLLRNSFEVLYLSKEEPLKEIRYTPN